MNEKLDEILKDEAVVKELLEQETAEDVQKLLSSKGVEMSIEEIEAMRKESIARNSDEEEMDDDQLEQVAGGANINKAQLSVLQDFINSTSVDRRW